MNDEANKINVKVRVKRPCLQLGYFIGFNTNSRTWSKNNRVGVKLIEPRNDTSLKKTLNESTDPSNMTILF